MLYRLEVRIERIETILPELPVPIHPIRDLFEPLNLRFAMALPPALCRRDKAALRQDFDVPGDGRPADVKVFRKPV